MKDLKKNICNSGYAKLRCENRHFGSIGTLPKRSAFLKRKTLKLTNCCIMVGKIL